MTTRKAVPLTSDEISAVNAARTSGALAELAGESAGRSESSALHALVVLGLQTVKEHRSMEGYAALAAAQDDEDRAYGAAIRGRRRGSSE